MISVAKLKKQNHENNSIVTGKHVSQSRYDELESFAISNFIEEAKDRSTLKAKCKNIFNWYLERNFELTQTVYIKKDKDLVMATRQEHAKRIHTKLANDTKKKVLNCITGMFKDEYRKKDGSWNVTKIVS